MSLFIFGFAMYLIVCGMYSSFIATSDPKNALVLYLIALSTVSILFVFEYYETIMLIVAAALVFTSLLIWAQTDPTEMVYNELISFVLLGGFYLISRYFFSYKLNYYLQLIEIKEKNLEICQVANNQNQQLPVIMTNFSPIFFCLQ